MFNYCEKHEYNPKSECWNLFWIIYTVLETSLCCLSKSITKSGCPFKISLQFCKNTAEIKLAIPQSFVIKVCMHTLTHSLYICQKNTNVTLQSLVKHKGTAFSVVLWNNGFNRTGISSSERPDVSCLYLNNFSKKYL